MNVNGEKYRGAPKSAVMKAGIPRKITRPVNDR